MDPSATSPSGSTRRRVVWDESNLSDNKAYFDAHPVTKPIDEPKTPYEPEKAMDEEGNFVDSDDEAQKIEKNPRQYDYTGHVIRREGDDDDCAGDASCHHRAHDAGAQWDEETKSFARRARMSAPVMNSSSSTSTPTAPPPTTCSSAQIDTASSPDQSDFKKRRVQRPMGLSLGTAPTPEELAKQEAEQHEVEFKHMRKAVYADEGAKFREQLRLAKLQAADEENEDDDDAQ